MGRSRLIIAPGKEKAILRRHPWIFSGAVKRIEGDPQEGDLVDVVDAHGQWLATGHYQNESIICKVLSFDTPDIDAEFFRSRFRSAIRYRASLGFFNYLDSSPLPGSIGDMACVVCLPSLMRQPKVAGTVGNRINAASHRSGAKVGEGDRPKGGGGVCLTNVFRLVHAEGDYLPGLVADWYNGVLVLQAHSVGMHRLFPLFVDILKDELAPYGLLSLFDKSSATCPATVSSTSADGYLFGPEPFEHEITESGNRLLINFYEGQKTGFFIDQRENRALVQQLAKGHRLLNCFGYTGGFSLAALRGGAEYVETVDISKKAVELCNRNVALNFGSDAPHRGVVADVLQYIQTIKQSNNQAFDFIILDPPAFAKNHRSLQQGLKGYRAINQRAMEALPAGGLLMTFSCSQAVSKEDFQTMVFTSAMNAGRRVRIIRQLPHAMDHPVSIHHPEGEYLKGLLLEVE